MASLTKRLAELEKRNRPAGKFVICENVDGEGNKLEGEAWERKLAAAHEEAGSGGTVIIVNRGGWSPEGRS